MKFIILILFGLSFNLIFACECETKLVKGQTIEETKLEESFNHATIIFYAEFLENRTFRIIKIFRQDSNLVNSNKLSLTPELTICDDTFELKTKYLVFGRVDEYGKLKTSYCYSNKQILNKSDLKFINKYLKK